MIDGGDRTALVAPPILLVEDEADAEAADDPAVGRMLSGLVRPGEADPS